MLYRDAKSHLNIARRVFFSQTPGLAQLGGTWLPVPHILMFPFIWNEYLYYSGLAGAIPSMISFLVLIVSVYLSVFEFTKDRKASAIAGLIILANPSLLYLQTTPMSELPLLALTGLSYLFLIRWIKRDNLTDLIRAAVCICIATLTRYDAWFIFVVECVLVILASVVARRTYKKTESNAFIFGMMGSFGIVGWLVYNTLIFGSPLNFALGQGSGSWDAGRVSAISSHSAKHDLGLSLQIFSWMSLDNVGIIMAPIFFIGVTYLFISKRFSWPMKLGALIFISPYIFNIVSLFLGQSVAFSKHVYPYETYNLRYGTAVLPAVAFFTGLVASRGWYVKVLVIIVFVFQTGYFISRPLEIIEDAKVGYLQSEIDVAIWARNNPAPGKVLLSTLAHDPLLFEARIPMGQLIYEGNQHLWKNALGSPDFFVDRIIMKSSDSINDQVQKALKDKPVLKEKYDLVYDDGDYRIYDKKIPH